MVVRSKGVEERGKEVEKEVDENDTDRLYFVMCWREYDSVRDRRLGDSEKDMEGTEGEREKESQKDRESNEKKEREDVLGGGRKHSVYPIGANSGSGSGGINKQVGSNSNSNSNSKGENKSDLDKDKDKEKDKPASVSVSVSEYKPRKSSGGNYFQLSSLSNPSQVPVPKVANVRTGSTVNHALR